MEEEPEIRRRLGGGSWGYGNTEADNPQTLRVKDNGIEQIHSSLISLVMISLNKLVHLYEYFIKLGSYRTTDTPPLLIVYGSDARNEFPN